MEVDVEKHQGLIANNVSFIASAVAKNQNQNTRFLCVDFLLFEKGRGQEVSPFFELRQSVYVFWF